MIRKENGEPWFIHGVGFDITDLKRTEEALQEERNVASAILDTVGALVMVLDYDGRIVRFNRACEQMSGYSFAEAKGQFVWTCFWFARKENVLKPRSKARAPTSARITKTSARMNARMNMRVAGWTAMAGRK